MSEKRIINPDGNEFVSVNEFHNALCSPSSEDDYAVRVCGVGPENESVKQIVFDSDAETVFILTYSSRSRFQMPELSTAERELYSRMVPGLFKVYWKTEEGGGVSLAAVGMSASGRRWFAPTNWLAPVWLDSQLAKIERVDVLKHGYPGSPNRLQYGESDWTPPNEPRLEPAIVLSVTITQSDAAKLARLMPNAIIAEKITENLQSTKSNLASEIVQLYRNKK